MLAEALKVVQAARSLEAGPGSAGLYRIGCEPRHIHRLLRELSETIQAFDKASAHGADAKAVLGRALRFAATQGVDMKAMMAAIAAPQAGETGVENDADPDLAPKPGEVGTPDRIQDISVSRQASRHGSAALGLTPDLAPRFEHDDKFPGTSAGPARHATPITGTSSPLDPTAAEPGAPKTEAPKPGALPSPQPNDQMEAIKRVEDRLEELAVMHGWTPKLKELDAALRLASQAMAKNVSPTGGVSYLLSEEAVVALERVEEDIGEMEKGRDAPDDDFARRAPGLF